LRHSEARAKPASPERSRLFDNVLRVFILHGFQARAYGAPRNDTELFRDEPGVEFKNAPAGDLSAGDMDGGLRA
jgi:hypothetical protein